MSNQAGGLKEINRSADERLREKKVILVTGVDGYWGWRVADALCANERNHVIGIDADAPQEQIKGLDFIQADIRNPLLVELLKSEQVDLVCHLAFQESTRPSESAFDYNVIGTMKVFGACAEAGVRKIILKSSTAVYGAHPGNSAFLTEDHPLMGSRLYGTSRDLVEIEAYCNGFRNQEPQTMLTILRFANIVGPKADTPLTRFLQEAYAPRLLGFDPLMQVIHENDVVDAIVFAVERDLPGVFNLAAVGPLPLSKLIGLAGKICIPVIHWFAYWGSGIMGNSAPVNRYLPIEPDYLRYNWVGDLAKMHEIMEFVPRYTSEEALRELAGLHHRSRFIPGSASLALDEERLRDTIERRRRVRIQQTSNLTELGENQANE